MSEKPRAAMPQVNAKGQQELNKAQEQFDNFDAQCKAMTVDKANEAPIQDFEPQTKMSKKEVADSGVKYLKPNRSISSKEPFNEKYRKEWEEAKQYVKFIAENYEVKGETITTWTKKFPGVQCEEWLVPTGKPVAGPRYLAQQIADCKYHILEMTDQTTSQGEGMQFYGQLVAKHTKQRLDARPCGNPFIAMGS